MAKKKEIDKVKLSAFPDEVDEASVTKVYGEMSYAVHSFHSSHSSHSSHLTHSSHISHHSHKDSHYVY